MAGILNKLTDGVNKGIATVGASSKAFVEKTRVNTAISNLEGERKNLTELLGIRVHDMYKQSGEVVADEGIVNFIGEIDKRTMQIDEFREKLRQIEEEAQVVTGLSSSKTTPVCQCGNNNVDGAKFCAKCGSAL